MTMCSGTNLLEKEEKYKTDIVGSLEIACILTKLEAYNITHHWRTLYNHYKLYARITRSSLIPRSNQASDREHVN